MNLFKPKSHEAMLLADETMLLTERQIDDLSQYCTHWEFCDRSSYQDGQPEDPIQAGLGRVGLEAVIELEKRLPAGKGRFEEIVRRSMRANTRQRIKDAFVERAFISGFPLNPSALPADHMRNAEACYEAWQLANQGTK